MEIECGCGKTIKSNLNDTEYENAAMNFRSILKAFERHLEQEHDNADRFRHALADCFKSALEDSKHKSEADNP